MILLKETVAEAVKELGRATAREACAHIYPGWEHKRYYDPDLSRVSHKLVILRRKKELAVVDMFAKEKVYYVPEGED